VERRRIGPWCREDDELCIRYMEEAEERFQAQARECTPGDPVAATAAAAAAAAAALAAPELSNHPQPANTPAWLVRTSFPFLVCKQNCVSFYRPPRALLCVL